MEVDAKYRALVAIGSLVCFICNTHSSFVSIRIEEIIRMNASLTYHFVVVVIKTLLDHFVGIGYRCCCN